MSALLSWMGVVLVVILPIWKKVYTQYLTCEGSLNILTMASHMYWTLAPSAARSLLNQKFWYLSWLDFGLLFSSLVCSPPDVHQLLPVGFYIFAGISSHLGKVVVHTPCLNEKIDSGKTHLQDLAQWWRTSQGVDIPKISQFYWALFEKTRFLCFYIIKSMAWKGYFGPKYP